MEYTRDMKIIVYIDTNKQTVEEEFNDIDDVIELLNSFDYTNGQYISFAELEALKRDLFKAGYEYAGAWTHLHQAWAAYQLDEQTKK